MLAIYKRVLFLSTYFCCFINFGVSQEYSYKDPDSWKQNYPACGAANESPINIQTQSLDAATGACPTIEYYNFDDPPQSMKLINTGNTIKIEGDFSQKPKIKIQNSLFNGMYKFQSYSMHWAEVPTNGTEHAFSGLKYSSEGQSLYINIKYDSFAEAAKYNDGLLMFAKLYTQRGTAEESGFAQFASYLPQVRETMSSADIKPVSLKNLQLECQSYITYVGSLSTPPCTGNVTWILCLNSNPVFQEHLSLLQKTKLIDGVTNNIRPLQTSISQKTSFVSCDKKSRRRS